MNFNYTILELISLYSCYGLKVFSIWNMTLTCKKDTQFIAFNNKNFKLRSVVKCFKNIRRCKAYLRNTDTHNAKVYQLCC